MHSFFSVYRRIRRENAGSFKSQPHFDFDEFEKKILSMEEEKIERYIRRKKRELIQTNLGDFYGGVVYAESYHSELGNELGKENVHLDYIAMINMGSKRVSFRTIHDHINVASIAALFGGGGHQKAAGCSLTVEAYKQFVLETFHLEPIPEDAKKIAITLRARPLEPSIKITMMNYLCSIQIMKWIGSLK